MHRVMIDCLMFNGQDDSQDADHATTLVPIIDPLKKDLRQWLDRGFDRIYLLCLITITTSALLILLILSLVVQLNVDLYNHGSIALSNMYSSTMVFANSTVLPGAVLAIVLFCPLLLAQYARSKLEESNCLSFYFIYAGLIVIAGYGIWDIAVEWAQTSGISTMWYEPQCYKWCTSRIEAQQAPLFTPQIYRSQFRGLPSQNMSTGLYSYSNFNVSNFAALHSNQILCSNGFQGNSDIYGLGVRIGLYTQWIASFCANHLQPETAKELQKLYLIVSSVLCIITLVFTFAHTCVFAVEIEILYWMFWGGSFSVFFSSPDSAKLESSETWMKLTFSRAHRFCIHTVMLYHAAWFMWFAYDHLFTKMPCGTYHFLFWKLIDPSRSFWAVRYILNGFFYLFSASLLLACPLTIVVFASETVHDIRENTLFQVCFGGKNGLSDEGTQQAGDAQRSSTAMPVRDHQQFSHLYGSLRRYFGLPAHTQQGIRLITPVDTKDRRNYRICCAVLGALSCILSIAAIELTLKWNRITGIYSLTSVGQYMPLTIGIGSLISVLWQLVTQETKRRRKLRQHQRIDDEFEELELQSFCLADALAHAFQQADAEYLANGGVRPPTSWADDDEERSSISSSVRPSMESLYSANESTMDDILSTVQRPDSSSANHCLLTNNLRGQQKSGVESQFVMSGARAD